MFCCLHHASDGMRTHKKLCSNLTLNLRHRSRTLIAFWAPPIQNSHDSFKIEQNFLDDGFGAIDLLLNWIWIAPIVISRYFHRILKSVCVWEKYVVRVQNITGSCWMNPWSLFRAKNLNLLTHKIRDLCLRFKASCVFVCHQLLAGWRSICVIGGVGGRGGSGGGG